MLRELLTYQKTKSSMQNAQQKLTFARQRDLPEEELNQVRYEAYLAKRAFFDSIRELRSIEERLGVSGSRDNGEFSSATSIVLK